MIRSKLKNLLKSIYSIIPFKKELFLILKLVWRPPEYIYKHLHFKGIFTIKIGEKSFKMHHFGWQIENEIFWSGLDKGWEEVSISLWIVLCKASNCIMDIGANTGIYALIAKTVNPSSKVYAFEPVKRVYDKLKSNVKLNKYDIICEEFAVSSYDGRGIIYDQNTEHIYSVSVNKNIMPSSVNVIKTGINTISLETYIKNKSIPEVDLIKIDVETHEAEVLKGMGDYLEEMHPVILIEVLNDEVGRKIEAILEDKDYLYFNIDEENHPRQVVHITKSDSYNYLMCNREIAEKLKLV